MKTRAILTVQIAALVLISVPARADVYLNCADLGNGVIELSYVNEEPIPIRAFGLDISVSNGVIADAGNFNPHYYVYPNSIEIIGGDVVDWGSPIVGGLGASDMTIEMASLYPPGGDPPPPSGVMLVFIISAECDITVQENALRGGVVFEDPEHSAPVHLPGLAGALPPEPEEYGGGSGTAADPFLISSAEQLNTIGLNPADMRKHFKLVADIDLDGYTGIDFNIIGNYLDIVFKGVFDGNSHRISNLTYTSSSTTCVGLFGQIDSNDAQIRDLDLIEPNVNSGLGDNVGSLVGRLKRGTVSRCSAQTGCVTGRKCVGGLVGRNNLGVIVNSYAHTDVTGDANLGGLVGRTYVEVSDCYSTGSVYQYADPVGGLVGFNHGTISSSFYDQQTSGQEEGAGGAGGSAVTDVNGIPTLQMQTQTTFTDAGWDFKGETQNGTDDVWTICEGMTYPRLARQGYIGNFTGTESIDLRDLAALAAAWKSTLGDDNWNGLCDISEPPDNIIDAGDLAVFALNYLSGAE
jgi:hypothetical protein